MAEMSHMNIFWKIFVIEIVDPFYKNKNTNTDEWMNEWINTDQIRSQLRSACLIF